MACVNEVKLGKNKKEAIKKLLKTLENIEDDNFLRFYSQLLDVK